MDGPLLKRRKDRIDDDRRDATDVTAINVYLDKAVLDLKESDKANVP